ncbi:MAG: hypothetical protein KatS3mg111_3923 [Pirellulaceae bacterium]|nr:MAG: hypothetical protein KatS3mg111_3923 [Pirellulaceae bacterium]
MNNKAWQEAISHLPDSSSTGRPQELLAVQQLIEGDLPLQPFLEQLLPHACQLFGGVAAVTWLKAAGAPGAVFGIRYLMDGVLQSLAGQQKHERLVQIAWRQRKPMLAEPTRKKASTPEDAEHAQLSSHNPTAHPLLFGPILHLSEPIALLEIVLATRGEPLTGHQRQLYLRGIQLFADRVYQGLRRRMTLPAATLRHATEQLEQLVSDVQALQQQILRTIEARLQQFHGWSFPTIAENQEFAKMVHQMLDAHGLRVQCTECGSPAILRCLRAGNAKNGAFVFDHYLESGRTFHGGPTTVPRLKVVPKPARRSAISNTA